MDIKSTTLMYLHKEGKVAEYTPTKDKFWYELVEPLGYGFLKSMYFNPDLPGGCFKSRDEALQAAMDYHETEGCKLYLELYPAPEKGEWGWIAQDCSGKWWGYKGKPVIWEAEAVWTEPNMRISDNPIYQSPPNPFWRKTLQ